MNPAAVRTGLRICIVAAVVAAIVLVETTTRSGVLWRLITFTYQANLLAAAFYVWTLVSRRADARAGLRGAVVVYVLVAGVIWNLFLTEASMGYTPANLLLHVLVPLLAVAEWLLVGDAQGSIRWWQPLIWLLYPAAYVGLALLVLSSAGRRVPYYFLDPDAVGNLGVLANVGLLGLVFVGFGYALMAHGRSAARARVELG
ncbi:Pr6Pr family membrane protein [Mycolicibacterium wolinskyi]|uniref:Pr6Pr family membrane protein n=1 Tax=Mycolicibacterium wolinskyi TaxID=59750 RepID=UPI003917A416